MNTPTAQPTYTTQAQPSPANDELMRRLAEFVERMYPLRGALEDTKHGYERNDLAVPASLEKQIERATVEIKLVEYQMAEAVTL